MTVKLFKNGDPMVVVRMKDTVGHQRFQKVRAFFFINLYWSRVASNVVLDSLSSKVNLLCVHTYPLFFGFSLHFGPRIAG